MSQIRKTGLTLPAQTRPAELRTIESNLRPACIPLQVSFTNEALTPSGFSPVSPIADKSVHQRRRCAQENHKQITSKSPENHKEIIMKTTVSMLFAAALVLSSMPARAVVLDLSTLTCKQFVEGGDDEIKMVLTWMDGWYKGDEDEAIIDTEVFVDNAKKFGEFCAKNPTISIVNAAEKILGK
jgi:acid stress chaperone HdeB